tara:strand:- start:97721 stop:99094 length:1374 start_codon:yes stop_codon:yes gene_type:complete
MNQISNSELDRNNFIHPLTHLAKFERGEIPSRVMMEASGVRIKDSNNIEYIDAFSGLYCVNVGYGQKDIINAIIKQTKKLPYYHAYYGNSTEVSIKLSEMIINRCPDNMSKIYFGLTGSDANETNIKMLWHYNNLIGQTKRKKIISRIGAYHGAGVLSGSLTGLKQYHKNFDLPINGILHTQEAYYFHRENLDQTEDEFASMCAEQLEDLIIKERPETIAGFIAEPVMGNGGLVPPPKGYWELIKKILKKYNIALIADEVITGFGRLGCMFGIDYYDIEADMITIAKGLTSAYCPLSGSILSDDIWSVIRDSTDIYGPLNQGSTYSAHPISCAAAVANLELIDKENLIKKGSEVAKYFNDSLFEKMHSNKFIGDIRSVGLLSAIELVKDKKERRFFDKPGNLSQLVVNEMSKKGILVRAMPAGDTIGFAPAFCLEKKDADQIIDTTVSVINDLTKNI